MDGPHKPRKPHTDSPPAAEGPKTSKGGIVVLDKPSGMSSMRGVAIVRRKAGLKAGHAGTLDPLATGVLVVAIGPATKSLDRFMKTDKRYHTMVDLSGFTATDDREGELEIVDVADPPRLETVRDILADRFTGRFMQQPPNFSARKVNGQRAYKVARQGGQPKLEPREVVVHQLDVLSYQWPNLELDIRCEKGFYVRSLARELGQALGTGGHCASIRRTAVGPFTIDEAIEPDELPEPVPTERVIPISEALERIASTG